MSFQLFPPTQQQKQGLSLWIALVTLSYFVHPQCLASTILSHPFSPISFSKKFSEIQPPPVILFTSPTLTSLHIKHSRQSVILTTSPCRTDATKAVLQTTRLQRQRDEHVRPFPGRPAEDHQPEEVCAPPPYCCFHYQVRC